MTQALGSAPPLRWFAGRRLHLASRPSQERRQRVSRTGRVCCICCARCATPVQWVQSSKLRRVCDVRERATRSLRSTPRRCRPATWASRPPRVRAAPAGRGRLPPAGLQASCDALQGGLQDCAFHSRHMGCVVEAGRAGHDCLLRAQSEERGGVSSPIQSVCVGMACERCAAAGPGRRALPAVPHHGQGGGAGGLPQVLQREPRAHAQLLLRQRLQARAHGAALGPERVVRRRCLAVKQSFRACHVVDGDSSWRRVCFWARRGSQSRLLHGPHSALRRVSELLRWRGCACSCQHAEHAVLVPQHVFFIHGQPATPC